LPADNIEIGLFSDYFNNNSTQELESINNANTVLLQEKTELEDSLDGKNEEEKIAINKKIDDIYTVIQENNSKILAVKVVPSFAETEGQVFKIASLEADLDARLEEEDLGDIKDFDSLNEKYSTASVLENVRNITTEKVDNKKVKVSKVVNNLKNFLESTTVYNKEDLLGILSDKTTTDTKKITLFLETLQKDAENMGKFLKLKTEYKEKIDLIKSEVTSVESTNHLFEALLKQFEEGNRDGELLDILRTQQNNSKLSLSSVDKDKVFSTSQLEELLNVTSNDMAIVDNLLYILPEQGDPGGDWESVADAINKISIPSLKSNLLSKVNEESDNAKSTDEIIKIQKVLTNLNNFKQSNAADVKVLAKAEEIFSKSDKFISNSIYDFIKDFSVSLNIDTNPQVIKIMDILKKEEYALYKASDPSNYLSDGVDIKMLQQAADVLEIFKSVINGLSTTTVNEADPVGFIATRQSFAKLNDTKSDVLNLKTITSDTASLINTDIDRILNKLGFLKVLLFGNSGKLYEEQESIRKETNKLLLNA
jgi:hypothetical protein